MNDSELHEYRTLAEQIEPPEELLDMVIKKANTIRHNELNNEGNHASLAFTKNKNRFSLKVASIAACAALLVGIGVFSFLSLTNSPSQQITDESSNSVDSQKTTSTDLFQMVVFADAQENKDGVRSVLLDSKDFSFTPDTTHVGYIYDAATDTVDYDTIEVIRGYRFNLTCEGEGLVSVTYTIEGNDLLFYGVEEVNEEIIRPNGTIGTITTKEHEEKEFTVDYNKQDESIFKELRLNYHLTNEGEHAQAKTAWDNLYENRYSVPANSELYSQSDIELAKCDAKKLSSAKLILAAQFSNEITQIKSYQIVPVENFEEAYAEYLRVIRSPEFASGETPVDFPQLYYLTEENTLTS